MNVLVTGGAGFIGSHLCDSLLADGEDVICVDNLSTGRRTNLQDARAFDSFQLLTESVNADCFRIGDLFEADIDAIYHLASRASPTDFEEHALDIALTSSRGTYNVLELARKHDARVLLVSTSEVYGDPEQHPQPETYNGNVNFRGPRACYDEGKRFVETLGSIYADKYDLDIRTVRPFNTYGPRMRPDDGRVIPTFVKQAARNVDLTVYGDGSQTRSFLYISDQVAGMRRLMDRDGLNGTVVNIGSDREITIQQLAELVLDLFDTQSEIIYEPLREDDPSRRKPDLTRAKELLEWEQTVHLEDGLRRTYRELSERILDQQ